MPVCGLSLLLTACMAVEPAHEPEAARLSLKALMSRVVDPQADRFWAASGTITTEQGSVDRSPTDDQGWEDTANAAAVLVESSWMLTTGNQRPDDRDWLRFARQLGVAAAAGLRAAESRNASAVFDTGGEIYLACRGCHMRYLLGYSTEEALRKH